VKNEASRGCEDPGNIPPHGMLGHGLMLDVLARVNDTSAEKAKDSSAQNGLQRTYGGTEKKVGQGFDDLLARRSVGVADTRM
jgi:hypothetical protein